MKEMFIEYSPLKCLGFLFDLKYIKINGRGKQGVFCFCMWSVYFSTKVFFFMFLIQLSFLVLHTYFFMAPVISKILWGQSGANTQNYEKKSNFDITSLDSI